MIRNVDGPELFSRGITYNVDLYLSPRSNGVARDFDRLYWYFGLWLHYLWLWLKPTIHRCGSGSTCTWLVLCVLVLNELYFLSFWHVLMLFWHLFYLIIPHSINSSTYIVFFFIRLNAQSPISFFYFDFVLNTQWRLFLNELDAENIYSCVEHMVPSSWPIFQSFRLFFRACSSSIYFSY